MAQSKRLGVMKRVLAAVTLASIGAEIMKLMLALILCGPMALSTLARADDQSMDAAIGGAVGGRLAAYTGSEFGGRDGATLGGAGGAATGVVVTTAGHRYRPERGPYYASPPTSRPHYRVPSQHDSCSPSQTKQGRC